MVHWLEFPTQTQTYTLVDAPADPRCIILGFHGYGERPAHCLEGLRKAGVEGALLVGPMGQHHFYDRKGKVVASWMTRFGREIQSEQILEYAHELLRRLKSSHGELPLYIFGFSQGASTAYRVASLPSSRPRRLFILAGDCPPDFRARLSLQVKFGVTILWGSGDTTVHLPALKADEEFLRGLGWPVELLVLAGEHDYFDEAMKVVGERIEADLAAV
jgi:predicted esterase